MALVEIVEAICREQMQELAETIEGELKAECPKRTGRTAGSIHIEQMGDTSYRIGSNALTMLYADQGNGSEIITSSREFDRKGRRPGKLFIMNGMHTMYVPYVRPYEGKHFVEKVANRHR